MKRIALASAALSLVFGTSSTFAANSLNSGSMGLNVPIVNATSATQVNNPIISGKYFMAKDMAVLGGFGFSSGGPSGASATTFSLLGGVRKYLKTDDFAPFVGGVLGYETTSSTPSSSSFTLAAEGGAEYFMAKQFSVEGKVTFGYQSYDYQNLKTTTFGTSTANVSFNFYF